MPKMIADLFQGQPSSHQPGSAGMAESMRAVMRKNDAESAQAHSYDAPTVKEAKQAEFLVHSSFPWDLVEAVGVISEGVRRQAEATIAASTHRPTVIVRPKWYY